MTVKKRMMIKLRKRWKILKLKLTKLKKGAKKNFIVHTKSVAP
jgi:hypothetical protein